MSARGQKVLVQHLTDPDSLDVLASEGLSPDIIPTDIIRPIVAWAVEYYFRSGCNSAPSITALRDLQVDNQPVGDILDDNLIDLTEEPEDTIEWAIEDLKGTYIHRMAAQFNKAFATDMSTASTHERTGVLNHYSTELIGLAMKLSTRSSSIDVRDAVDDLLLRYEARKENIGKHFGMHFGIPMIDLHTHFIHDGELAVVAGGPKIGKSFLLDWIAYQEWLIGRSVVLFTLENSVEMTVDRIATYGAKLNSEAWQRGDADSDAVESAVLFRDRAKKANAALWIIQPDLGKRTVEHMVREAQLRGADSLLIDQLNHIELPNPRKPKNERIGDALHLLHGLISTGRHRMPCLLASHINRDGVRAAARLNRLEMDHLADSSEIERTADWVFGMFASNDDVEIGRMMVQTLACRRAKLMHWLLEWKPGEGIINELQEMEL